MATAAQIDANRLNARKSTGPRTEAGKSVSRFNALQHGFEARSLVIPGENPAELETLATEYHDRFQPLDALERYLVDTLVHSDWDRRRYARIQAEYLQMDLTERRRHAAAQAPAFESRAVQIVYRRLTAAERSFFRALKELTRIQRERAGQEIAEAELASLLGHGAASAPKPAAPAPAPTESTPIGFVPEKPSSLPHAAPEPQHTLASDAENLALGL